MIHSAPSVVEFLSVAVAILHESWDRQDNLRPFLEHSMLIVEGLVERRTGEQEMEKLEQGGQLSTIP